jgi:hypothetical protein
MVTLQESSGDAFAAPEPAKTATPVTIEVINELPRYGEFECEWALAGAEQ